LRENFAIDGAALAASSAIFFAFRRPANGAAGLEQRRKTYLLTQGRLDVCRM